VWNGTSVVGGVTFPSGTRSVLFFGHHGTGPFCYGEGGATGECPDPANDSKGNHAFPYKFVVWAYDANDLAAVKAGQREAWNVWPYAIWDLTLPYTTAGYAILKGAAFDPQTGRIYVAAGFSDADRPVIHVFQVPTP
jgi:hypothetical protein